MDNKQMPDDKIAAEELLSDSELDSVTGGGRAGQTGPGYIPVDKPRLLPSNPTNEVKYGGQLGLG